MSMQPWQSILVAVRDPAQRPQLALHRAARLAAASGARLTLFHAFSTPYPLPQPLSADPGRIVRDTARRKRAQLLAAARPLRAAGLKVDCEVVWDFPPAHAIVRRALAGKPDLVVAESHRHSRVARWFLANSDWELIRECPCPVWFVKRRKLARRPLLLAALDPTHAHAKPAGLDDRLLQLATSIQQSMNARLALVHVQDVTRLAPPLFLATLPAVSLRPSASLTAAAEAAIERLANRHAIAASAVVVKPGLPAEVITTCAADLKADVVIMGAVSRSGLKHAFVGSTAEAVIDDVGCDVLIVKPRQFRTKVSRRAPQLAATLI